MNVFVSSKKKKREKQLQEQLLLPFSANAISSFLPLSVTPVTGRLRPSLCSKTHVKKGVSGTQNTSEKSDKLTLLLQSLPM